MDIVGTLWNRSDIEIVEVDGRMFALYNWNGEAYTECWEVADSRGYEQINPDNEYTLRPVYRYEVDDRYSEVDEDSELWDESVEVVDYNYYLS